MNDRIRVGLEKKNGGNQSEMARFVGVSPQAVQKWIAGLSTPKGKNLQKTAEYLGMTELELRYGTVDPAAPANVIRVMTWPFSIPHEEFAGLAPDERAAIDRQVSYMVRDFQTQKKSKKKTG